MREKKKYFIVTFHTTSDALELERKALSENLEVKLIPAPRCLTPGCGMALRCSLESENSIRDLVEKFSIETEEMLTLIM